MMAEKVLGWLEKILLPQLSELRGEVRAVNGRIDGLEGKFAGKFETLEGKVQGLGNKMDGQFAAVHSEIRRLGGRSAPWTSESTSPTGSRRWKVESMNWKRGTSPRRRSSSGCS